MIEIDDTLYYSSVKLDTLVQKTYWQDEVMPSASQAGNWHIDVAKRFPYNRFMSRDGSEWSMPWKQEIIPHCVMPKYNPNYSKTFEQITNERAYAIRDQIHQGVKFAVMYSGGMDSTLVLVALLKNLTEEELKSVVVCASVHSIIENPMFWQKYIHGKLKVLDSSVNIYNELIAQGLRPITADEGDCIFGTSFGLQLYHNFEFYVEDISPTPTVRHNLLSQKHGIADGNVHYSVFKDIIIRHFRYDLSAKGFQWAKLFYEKLEKNIATASVPIYSLHDYFWWMIFNIKYLHCATRSSIFFNKSIPINESFKLIENWFAHEDYQLWSMVNNNNGKKIKKTLATYKYELRQYIYDFDKNFWYLNFKTKLESLGNLSIKRSVRDNKEQKSIVMPEVVGLNKKYELITTENEKGKEFFKHHLSQYKFDWV
jgi:hypothetical protein